MARTFVFVNQKGGVGKTTSAINIGAYLALAGKKTLLVDFDSQANLTSGIGGTSTGPGIYNVVSGQAAMEDILVHTKVKNLDLAPSSINLSGATVELVNRPDRNEYLKRAISSVAKDYDFVLIDCPPSLGILTLNGLVAADEAFIPMQCEYFALEGLSLILQTVGRIQKTINQSLTVGGIFFTMYDSRTKLAQEVVQQVNAYFKDRVFRTIIPRNVRLSEAPSHGLPICLYDPSCIGAKSYEALCREIINREQAATTKGGGNG